MTSAITRRLLSRGLSIYDHINVTSCFSTTVFYKRTFYQQSETETRGNNVLDIKITNTTKLSLYSKRPFSSSVSDRNKEKTKHEADKGVEKAKDDKEEDEKKLSLFQKFKRMYRDYWYVLVPVHLVTSTVWFGGFYYMAKSGIDIVALLESWHVSPKLVNPLKDSSMGYIAFAYALYKIATPARYTVTLGGTTISINYLKKWGYIKPVPSKEQMKKMYIDKKETLTRSMKETKEGIIEKKENLMETLHEKKEGIKGTKESIMKTVSQTTKSLKKQKHEIKEKVTNLKDKT